VQGVLAGAETASAAAEPVVSAEHGGHEAHGSHAGHDAHAGHAGHDAHAGHAGHDAQAAAEADGEQRAEPASERVTRQGVVVEFSASPAPGRSMSAEEIHAGDFVDVSFRLLDASTEQPLKGQFPGAWMDLARSWKGDQALLTTCKERVGSYLQGSVGMRPLLDLNSYFVLVMNRDPSISVIDPITGIAGITKLYAQVNLEEPGADWTRTEDQKRLFVTMPRAGQVAVVDTDTFKVATNVPAGTNPVRIALQPDGHYLWVGNDSEDPDTSGVTVIDAEDLSTVAHVPTGLGHHEIAFSSDSRFAFVTNEDEASVSVIDVRRLARVRDVETGPAPVGLAWSSLRGALYVSDAEKGEIAVVAGPDHAVATRIRLAPGLGPVRFSQDGRWGVTINSREDVAYVIDPSTDEVVHTLEVGSRPYQVAFSRSFAYVRSEGTERVAMIDLSELGKPERPPVVTFGAGQKAPEQVRDLSIADAVVEAPGEAAVLVVSPADTTVYYYMEGMNAPMGNFRNYGHLPVAVTVVDRSMQEREPGVYSSTVRIPDSGVYEVAFLLDSPSLLQCFEMKARPNPLLARKGPPIAVQHLNERKRVAVGETVDLRFRITDRDTEQPRTDLADVSLHYFVAPGGRRMQAAARHTGDGIYEATVTLEEAGAYYLYVACPSAGVRPADLAFTTVVAGRGARWR
jgi:YVTN family beta-propeller protein